MKYKGFTLSNVSTDPSFPSYQVTDKKGCFVASTLFPSELKEIVERHLKRMKVVEHNLEVLEEHNISFTGKGWDDEPYSGEFETYTDAGEDMIFTLETITRNDFKQYIDDFDVNENVLMWWHDGYVAAHKAGVPFENIKEHYQDYEDWLEELSSFVDELEDFEDDGEED